MSEFDLVIGPLILFMVLFGGIFLLVLWYVRAKIRALNADARAADLPVKLLETQDRAITDTIYELEVNQLSTVFPEKLKNELMDAHSAYMGISRGRRSLR